MESKNIPDTGIKSFKTAIKRRCLKLSAAALLAVAIFDRTGETDILLGLILGICVGFVNINLMFYNLNRMKISPEKAQVRTFIITLIRFALIVGAGIAAVHKFNLWAMLSGFLLTYVSIISIPITERIKSKLLIPKSKADVQ